MTDRALWHPSLRIERLIRSIREVRWDREVRRVMQLTLVESLREKEKIRRAGWMN